MRKRVTEIRPVTLKVVKGLVHSVHTGQGEAPHIACPEWVEGFGDVKAIEGELIQFSGLAQRLCTPFGIVNNDCSVNIVFLGPHFSCTSVLPENKFLSALIRKNSFDPRSILGRTRLILPACIHSND